MRENGKSNQKMNKCFHEITANGIRKNGILYS